MSADRGVKGKAVFLPQARGWLGAAVPRLERHCRITLQALAWRGGRFGEGSRELTSADFYSIHQEGTWECNCFGRVSRTLQALQYFSESELSCISRAHSHESGIHHLSMGMDELPHLCVGRGRCLVKQPLDVCRSCCCSCSKHTEKYFALSCPHMICAHALVGVKGSWLRFLWVPIRIGLIFWDPTVFKPVRILPEVRQSEEFRIWFFIIHGMQLGTAERFTVLCFCIPWNLFWTEFAVWIE